MTQDEKREVNEKIGRALFSWTPYKGNESPMPYCTDPVFVVPLAEALRARGWDPYLISYIGGGWMWRAIQHVPILRAVTAEADTIQEALAIVTARAVGTETKE